jgi:transitional endoplasmic reticulum ATPase
LLARAVATESEFKFISIKGAEIFSKWVGESGKAIREVFRKARMAAPAIVFLDETDALTPKRNADYDNSGVSEQVISQLLTEIDGINNLHDVVVIAATNRPDMIDPAVIRSGRFDRLIYVPGPDDSSRMQIFKLYTKNMPLDQDVDIDQLVVMTKHCSGADIESLCREAAMYALRQNVDVQKVTMKDFQIALEEIRPSTTPDMEKWYKSFMQTIRQVQKSATPVI